MFQHNGSGKSKIAGIKRFGGKRFHIKAVDIDEQLSAVIDDSSLYLPESLDADLVLDYLTHPDLSCDLALLCKRQNIPVIASGKKLPGKMFLKKQDKRSQPSIKLRLTQASYLYRILKSAKSDRSS